ncbi:hypothetical protein [Wolbachia endosymbiont of Litomosoides sigmodontis]
MESKLLDEKVVVKEMLKKVQNNAYVAKKTKCCAVIAAKSTVQ